MTVGRNCIHATSVPCGARGVCLLAEDLFERADDVAAMSRIESLEFLLTVHRGDVPIAADDGCDDFSAEVDPVADRSA